MQGFNFLWFCVCAFFKNFLTWGNLMPEYQHTFIRIFNSIWLIHLQDRKKYCQDFTSFTWTTALQLRATAGLHVEKKFKKSCSIPSHSHSPLRFFHFLPMAFFRSECVSLTSGNKGCFVLLLRFVCVTLELFLESAITIFIDLVELYLEWKSQMAILVFMCEFATI